jgi:hypothetical protein
MRPDELIEELAREHRYRGVLVVSAVIGVAASAVIGLALALGGFSVGQGSANPANLAFFVVPFAASIVIGGGVHRVLVVRDRARGSKRRGD